MVLTIEVTINKGTKTSGGLIGKTLYHESVNQCVCGCQLTRHSTTYAVRTFKRGMSKASVEMHKDGSTA